MLDLTPTAGEKFLQIKPLLAESYGDGGRKRQMRPASEGGRYNCGSDAAEDDVGDFRGSAEADWRAYRADAAVYVEGGEAVGGVGH